MYSEPGIPSMGASQGASGTTTIGRTTRYRQRLIGHPPVGGWSPKGLNSKPSTYG